MTNDQAFGIVMILMGAALGLFCVIRWAVAEGIREARKEEQNEP